MRCPALTHAHILALLLCSSLASHAQSIIAAWNFNSPTPDAAVGTGSVSPSTGQGSATLIGGVTSTFASGDSQSDPVSSDNSALNTSGYPAAATNNLWAGTQFAVDTTGYENVKVSWSQRNSGTASRWLRPQYTIDGTEFVNLAPVSVEADSVFTNFVVDLSGIPGAADNSRFALRLLTEWESTAAGFGSESFVATKAGANYSTSGTIRFEMVTFSGTPIADANTPPTISVVPDQTLRVNSKVNVVTFTVGDVQDSPGELTVTTSSSNPALLPLDQLVVSGSGTERSLNIIPGTIPGVVTVGLRVTDRGGRSALTTFTVTILPANTAPQITVPPRTNTLMGTAVLVPVHVSDLETTASALRLTAEFDSAVAASQGTLAWQWSGTNLALKVSPSPGRLGTLLVRAGVSDGALSASERFALMVLPNPDALLWEEFDYTSGSPLTNSPYWTLRSGTPGQAMITNGALLLSSKMTEDVVAPFASGPVHATNSIPLYAAFRLTAITIPEARFGLLAHFGDGSTLRGRVYISATNASPGTYRLAGANGAGAPTDVPFEMQLGRAYTIVTRYQVDTATSAFWVNPTKEDDATATFATDSQSAARISGYGFRQDRDIAGDFLVDDLRVGKTFESVMSTIESPPQLRVQLRGSNVEITWSDADWQLQRSISPEGPYVTLSTTGSLVHMEPATAKSGFFRLTRQAAR